MSSLVKWRSSLRWLVLCLIILILAWPNLLRLTGDLSYLSARPLARAGYASSALWLLTQAQRVQPQQPYAYTLASRLFDTTGRLDASAAQLEIAVAADAVHPLVLNDLAVRRFEQGDTDGALELQEQAAVAAPNVAAVHYNLGVLYWRSGNMLAAARSFREAARIAPDWASPFLSLALIYLESKDYGEAEESAQRALTLQPDHPYAYEALIQSLLAQHKSASALEAIASAETHGVDADRLRLFQALALRDTGDSVASRIILERVFRWTDDPSLRRRVAVELRSLIEQ